VKILALDTATENCSVALMFDERMFTREQRLVRDHAQHLLPMVAAVLAQAELQLGALDALAFGRGPGAFTGVRLAASVAQGLAFGAARPVVPVSDLRALAQRALQADALARRVLVCADARMREVYWACYERDDSGLAAAVGAEQVGSPDSVQLPECWRGHAQAEEFRVRAAGTGFASYPQLRVRLADELGAISPDLLPRALEIAQLAVPEVQAGRILPADQALPVYVRDEVTQVQPDRSLN
jgi:tRNA threonylcarbamoyladenosine biosynthesis protein TsaB